MFEFLAFIAIVVLFVMLGDVRGRLRRAEETLAEAARRIGALQRQALLAEPAVAQPPIAQPPATQPTVTQPEPPEPLVEVEPVIEPEPEPAPLRAAALKAAPEAAVTAELVEPVAEPAAYVPPEPEPEPEPAYHEPAAPPSPKPSMASRFEELFGKQLPIWAGGITLAIAGVLIVKYAIDAGIFARIFTHGVQVITGLLFGTGLIAGAEFAWRNQDKVRDIRVPQTLSGAGLATLYAAILVAANAYALIAPLTAFIALALITAAALGLSLRFGAPSALLGLAGGLAAPAMTGSLEPNVPLLAVYLGLTIAGLTGVSRMQRWPWLALAALVGGAGWSLWMILASSALDTMASLSIGGFVLLLAIALPMLAMSGPRAALLRSASAIVGAAQLALLVAYGGFAPLHWGLFALLAAAGQWLAWREANFAIVPSISLALSGLLLAIWPDPAAYWFTLIGLSLAAVHALPLLARLWQSPPSLQRTLELCALAIAAPLLTKWHFWSGSDAMLARVALGAALLPGIAIARGWKHEGREGDSRFACLTATAAALLTLALVLILPQWQVPLGIAAIAAALLFFGKAAHDSRIEGIAAGFAGLTLPALVLTMPQPAELLHLWQGADPALSAQAIIRWTGLTALFALFAARAERRDLRFAALTLAGGLAYGALAQIVAGWSLPLAMAAVALALFAIGQRRGPRAVEALSGGFALAGVLLLAITGESAFAEWSRLWGSDQAVAPVAALRWGGLALLALLYAVRARSDAGQRAGQIAAALLAYGLTAQLIAGGWLMLAPAIGGAAMLLAARRFDWPRLHMAAASFGMLSAAWALAPLAEWTARAALSLAGLPMTLDSEALGLGEVIRRLLIPALLWGGALWSMRSQLPERISGAGLGLAALAAGIALHCLYRIGFTQAFGGDFVQTGLAQRLVWEALLIGGSWLAMRRMHRRLAIGLAAAGTAHALWYTLALHNPMWTEQAVGGLPLANLLIPAFVIVPLGLQLLGKLVPNRPAIVGHASQLLLMVLTAGFAWASLRQVFHGSLLTEAGVYPWENILRSIVILALAIGFLLWGIKARRHDWRIASLVLMLGAVGKVFLFDASGLEGLLRIGSFVALGFSLIGIGWLYSRQLATPAEGPQTAPAE